jgi:hypothetical protein
MAWVTRHAALAGSPAAASSTAGLAVYRFTHNPEVTLELAILAGTLTLASVLLLLLAQVAQSWLHHRSEHHFSSAVKRAVTVATGSVSAERRSAALETSERLGITQIAEGALTAIRITHHESGDARSARRPADSPESAESGQLNDAIYASASKRDHHYSKCANCNPP